MIGSALAFVANRMDTFIRQRLEVPPGTPKVILSPIVGPGGAIAVREENILICSLVSIQTDSIIGGNTGPRMSSPKHSVEMPPPIYLNLYIMLSAYFKSQQIQEGLDTLSIGISFLQGMPLWNDQTTPGLPAGIQKLIFELESPDFHQQSHIWGSIGAKYMPSALYKVRTIIIDDESIEQIVPRIEDINTDIR